MLFLFFQETDIPIDQKNKNEEGLAVQEKVINEKAGEDTIDVQVSTDFFKHLLGCLMTIL